MNKQSTYIVVSIFLFSISVTLIDAVVRPDYFAKIPVKILFFLVFPLVFLLVNKQDLREFKKLFIFKKSGILRSFLLGTAIYALIILGYFLTRNIIDFSHVTSNLKEGMGITANRFIYVSLYISFMNSFLEEIFFRGYGFITLKKYAARTFAYLFSSLMFAIYHIGMLIGMFRTGALCLLLLGLIAGGCIFNYLNESNDTIYPSWFVHMFANFGINTVGLILFGVL